MELLVFSKSRILSGILLVLAVAIAATVTFVIYEQRTAMTSDDSLFNSTTAIARLDISESDYSAAASVWMRYAATSPNKSHQVDAYASAAGLYLSAGDNQRALSIVQTAQAKDGENYLLAEVGGQAAQNLGNKRLAISYDKTVLKLLPTSPLSDKMEEERAYQQSIQQLEQST